MAVIRDISKFQIDADHFWSKVDKTGDCWEYQGGLNTGGYGAYTVKHTVEMRNETGKRNTQLGAHRVAFFLHHGSIDNDLLVCHTCDNRKCCRPDHLFQGDQQENVDDMLAKLQSGNKRMHTEPVRTKSYTKLAYKHGPRLEEYQADPSKWHQ